MPKLNVFNIRNLPKIFGWYADPVSCSYHHVPSPSESLKIFVERNIACEAQWLYLFELIFKDEFFLLKIFSGNDVDVDIAGREKETVINFVVGKIMKKTTMGEKWEKEHPTWVERHQIAKAELKKILEKLVRDFIG